MLKRKMKQLLIVLCTVLVVISVDRISYSGESKEKQKDLDTSVLEMIYNDEKSHQTEGTINIDIDTGLTDETAKYLKKEWAKLKPETRKKIKEWRNSKYYSRGVSNIPSIIITTPKETEITYSNKIRITGTIETFETSDITKTWADVNGTSYELKLKRTKVKTQEEVIEDKEKQYNDKTMKKRFIENKQKYKDKPEFAEIFGTPRKYVYEFNEQIELPGPGVYRVEVKASNQAGESIHEFNPYFYVIYPDKNNQDKTPPEVEMKLAYCNTWINESTGLMETKYEFIDDNVVIKNNIGLWQIVKDECKTVIFILYKGGDYRGTYTMQSSGNAGWGSLKDVSPGENKFKYIFIDAQGNKTTKELTVYRK